MTLVHLRDHSLRWEALRGTLAQEVRGDIWAEVYSVMSSNIWQLIWGQLWLTAHTEIEQDEVN